ncbi:Acyl-CoA Delta(11) desaturase, partial [Blattella germanica]
VVILQNPLFQWVRDHRVHHKYTETDADPHNSKRGFFFAHVGWLMQQKHPEVIRRGNMINMNDILADPVVNFHQKYFWPMKIWWCFTFPVLIPSVLWGESWIYSLFGMAFMRYCYSLNFTWLVNSAAHIWGNKPYDKKIDPVENRLVALVSMGEGWHNYHHCFPWDYRAEELAGFFGYSFNITTLVIDMFGLIGWAYDRKVPDSELIRKIAEKRGDGTYSKLNCKNNPKHSEDHTIVSALEIWDTERDVKSDTLSPPDNLKKE